MIPKSRSTSSLSSLMVDSTSFDNSIQSKSHSYLPLIGFLLFGIFYLLPIMTTLPLAHTCLALLIGVVFLWSTEAIPPYSISYLILIISVWFDLGMNQETHDRMPPKQIAILLCSKFMDSVIFVFLGSMTMSACLSKLKITDRVSSYLLPKLSKDPKWILLSVMLLNVLIGSVLSNVASTTIVLTFCLPTIRFLHPDSTFTKALLLGIAWSGNTAGQSTPISSPQNILAMKYISEFTSLKINFFEFCLFAVPTSLLILFFEWLFLCFSFHLFRRQEILFPDEVEKFSDWTFQHTLACVVCSVTFILWSLNDIIPFLGDVGVTSAIPIFIFFGSGILDVADFNSIKWNTLTLMGGGLALGKSMEISGLLDVIGSLSSRLAKIPVWPLLVIFLFAISLLASMLNHTSAAAILFPVIRQLGQKTGRSAQLVLLCALMVSAAQMFHISGFPNALISGVCKHQYGKPQQITPFPFLKGVDFPKYAWVTIFIAVLVIASVPYGITIALNLFE